MTRQAPDPSQHRLRRLYPQNERKEYMNSSIELAHNEIKRVRLRDEELNQNFSPQLDAFKRDLT